MVEERSLENWTKLQKSLNIGDVVSGTVFQIENYGVYVDIGEDFYGIVLLPYISKERLESLSDYPQVGSIVNTIVIDFSFSKENIEFSYVVLSIKDYTYR